MNESVPDMLEDFVTNLEETNIEAAKSILVDIREEYDSNRETELSLSDQSRLADVEDGEEEALTNYRNSFVRSRPERFGFKLLAGIVVDRYEQLEGEDGFSELLDNLEESATELEALENTFSNHRDAAEEAIEQVTIPPAVEILSADIQTAGAVPLKNPETIELLIKNVGDGQATQVSVELAASPGTTVTEESMSVGNLAGGESTALEFDIEVEWRGRSRVSVELTSENGGSDGTVLAIPVEGVGPPPLPGHNTPRDVDGDGLYEDVRGDGKFDIADVQLLFESLTEPRVQENAAFYNFSGSSPSEVTIFDVQMLFNRLQRWDGPH